MAAEMRAFGCVLHALLHGETGMAGQPKSAA